MAEGEEVEPANRRKPFHHVIVHWLGWFVGRYLSSYWKISVTVAAFLGAVGFGTYGYLNFRDYQNRHSLENQYAADQYAADRDDKMDIECVPVLGSEALRCSGDAPSAKGEEYTARADLRAQQEMSEWAYSLLIIGALGLGASVVGIGFVYLNLVATRKIGEDQNKAYARIESATFVAKTFSGSPGFKWVARNDGQTPAVHAQLRYDTIVGPLMFGTNEAKNAETRINLNRRDAVKFGVVRPNDTKTVVWPNEWMLDAVKEWNRRTKAHEAEEPGSDFAIYYLIGKFYYDDVFGNHHESEVEIMFPIIPDKETAIDCGENCRLYNEVTASASIAESLWEASQKKKN